MRRININFGDIENALSKFSGDDSYGIVKWAADFEEITAVHACSDQERFTFARRIMSGSAVLLLRMISPNTWSELKQELCKEFDKPISARDTFKKLESRV